MRTTRSRWRALGPSAALLALTVTMAGCTADAAPSPPSPVSSASVSPAPTPEPAESPTPTPPSPPAAAAAADLAGAEASARHAIDALNYASATADLTEWNRVTAPSCEMCVAFADDIVAAGPEKGGVISIESSKATEITPGTFATVVLIINQAPFTNPDGTPNEGGRYAFLIAMRFTDSWVVEAVDVALPDAPWAS